MMKWFKYFKMISMHQRSLYIKLGWVEFVWTILWFG